MAIRSLAVVCGLLRHNHAKPLVFMVRHHRANRLTYKAMLDSEGNRLDNRTKLTQLREEIFKSELSGKPGGADIEPEIRQPRKKLVIKPKQLGDQAVKNNAMGDQHIPQGNRNVEQKNPANFDLKPRHKKRLAPHIIMEEAVDSGESEEEISEKFFIPRYTKLHAWDKSNVQVKKLGKLLSCKKERQESDLVVVESTRIISDALRIGVKPELLVFSRVKLLHALQLDPQDMDYDCYHVPYNNIKLWSDLATPTGIMAAFNKEKLADAVRRPAAPPLALSLVCDSVRSPDNLGAVMRVAAAAGARQLVLTRGCVEAWSPKVVRAAAGAHFQVPLVEGVEWEVLENYLEPYPQVILADLQHSQQSSMSPKEKEEALELLDMRSQEEGYQLNSDSQDDRHDPALSRDLSYLDPELTSAYRQLPLETLPYSSFAAAPGCGEAVVVVGGETEGVSDAAYRFCHKYNGARLYIPLLNGVNSLNVVSAASIVLFRVQEALLKNSQQ